jgi:hypothetical protein
MNEIKELRRQSRLTERSPYIETTWNSSSDAMLKCPRCRGEYLHQGRVTVFDRSEDDEQTAVTTVQCGLSATHMLPSGETDNPSSRRQGMTLAFECEYCEGAIELTIAQHKGHTYLGWRYEPARPRQGLTVVHLAPAGAA